MSFYRSDQKMQEQLATLLEKLESEGRKNLRKNISISWIRYNKANPSANSGIGASWLANKPLYPASVVKLIYAIATEAWLLKDLIPETKELRRALNQMIQASSNDATGLIVDLLTGTTSGPSLIGEGWESWKKQRDLINQWLKQLNWTELNNCNCCQKTWGDSPYGRENDFYGPSNQNRNALTTDGTARILEAIMTNAILSPRSCRQLRELLARTLDKNLRKSDPENQVDGFIGEGLPNSYQLWNKAGWMSSSRNDAAWFAPKGKPPMLLVIFSVGVENSQDNSLLPSISSQLIDLNNNG